MDETELRGWEQMVRDGLYPGPTATLRLIGKVRQLQTALFEYGRHKVDCVFHLDDVSDLEAYGPGEGCTCGFYDATYDAMHSDTQANGT